MFYQKIFEDNYTKIDGAKTKIVSSVTTIFKLFYIPIYTKTTTQTY